MLGLHYIVVHFKCIRADGFVVHPVVAAGGGAKHGLTRVVRSEAMMGQEQEVQGRLFCGWLRGMSQQLPAG